MSDPSPPVYELAHITAIHVTADATTALSADNKITGLRKYDIQEVTAFQELKQLNSDGYSRWVPIWVTATGSLEGDAQKGSATQTVLRNAVRNKTPVWITTIDTPDAAVGAHKGWRRCLWLESQVHPREAGTIVTFTYPLKQEGAPTELLGTA